MHIIFHLLFPPRFVDLCVEFVLDSLSHEDLQCLVHVLVPHCIPFTLTCCEDTQVPMEHTCIDVRNNVNVYMHYSSQVTTHMYIKGTIQRAPRMRVICVYTLCCSVGNLHMCACTSV